MHDLGDFSLILTKVAIVLIEGFHMSLIELINIGQILIYLLPVFVKCLLNDPIEHLSILDDFDVFVLNQVINLQ